VLSLDLRFSQENLGNMGWIDILIELLQDPIEDMVRSMVRFVSFSVVNVAFSAKVGM
jgi:hypothetical protein